MDDQDGTSGFGYQATQIRGNGLNLCGPFVRVDGESANRIKDEKLNTAGPDVVYQPLMPLSGLDIDSAMYREHQRCRVSRDTVASQKRLRTLPH
jgi:hypothetical protein